MLTGLGITQTTHFLSRGLCAKDDHPWGPRLSKEVNAEDGRTFSFLYPDLPRQWEELWVQSSTAYFSHSLGFPFHPLIALMLKLTYLLCLYFNELHMWTLVYHFTAWCTTSSLYIISVVWLLFSILTNFLNDPAMGSCSFIRGTSLIFHYLLIFHY